MKRSAKKRNFVFFALPFSLPKNAAALVLLRAVCINHGLDLFHQRIIILLIVDSAEHRLSHNISISIDQDCGRKCHNIGSILSCRGSRINGKIAGISHPGFREPLLLL